MSDSYLIEVLIGPCSQKDAEELTEEIAEFAAGRLDAAVSMARADAYGYAMGSPGLPCPRCGRESDARLIALAPDLAVLCADAIDALEQIADARPGRTALHRTEMQDIARATLARFAALQPDNTEEGT